MLTYLRCSIPITMLSLLPFLPQVLSQKEQARFYAITKQPLSPSGLKQQRLLNFFFASQVSHEWAQGWPPWTHCSQQVGWPFSALPVSMPEDKDSLGRLTLAVKCFDLQVTHVTFSLRSFIRTSHVVPPNHSEIRTYNPISGSNGKNISK